MYVCIYIYIERERETCICIYIERERERDMYIHRWGRAQGMDGCSPFGSRWAAQRTPCGAGGSICCYTCYIIV